MELIDNGMLYGAEHAYATLYVLDDTPWDLRKPPDLYRFVWEYDLEDAILDEYGDGDPDVILDHLPQDEAIEMIEDYIRCYDLIDQYNAWKAA